MTSLHTLPLTLPVLAAPVHEHAWLTESRHRTSEGTVIYVRCGSCPARRVDLQTTPQTPPVALSRGTGPLRP